MINRVPCFVLLAAVALPAMGEPGSGSAPSLQSDQCGITTRYDVLVDSGGVWLRHGPQAPHEVVFHDGELSLDGKMVEVNEADAARLRQLEASARRLMPEAAGLARDVVDLTFDAVDGVVEVMTGSKNTRKVRKVRREAQTWVDDSLGRGYWEQSTFGEGFEAHVEEMAEALAASLTRSVLWQVFTGRAGAMERRADSLETELEQRMEARGQQLEAKANALCPQVQALADVHDALQVQFNGQPLRLLERGE